MLGTEKNFKAEMKTKLILMDKNLGETVEAPQVERDYVFCSGCGRSAERDHLQFCRSQTGKDANQT